MTATLVTFCTTFAVIFLAELPDKSMFASLAMGTRMRPLWVWLGTTSAFAIHVGIAVADLDEDGQGVALSGLKDQIRQRREGFSEKSLGYGSFLQFVRGAAAQDVVRLERVEGGYLVHAQE